MNTTRLLRLSTSLLISFGIGLAASARSSETKSLVEGNTAFAFDLYARLSGTPGNMFFSPYSISTCLAVTYAGARGNTETQMSQVLHFSNDQPQLHSSFGELQRQLNKAEEQKGIQLDIANALWVQKGHPLIPAFLEIASNNYQANVNQADFMSSAHAATLEINRWVAQKTRDQIQDILSPGSVNDLTRLVLANAIYFKGMWMNRFEKAHTSTRPFNLSMTSQADVPLMFQIARCNYAEDKDFQVVELPYSGDELSMVILLPCQIDGLGRLEKQLSPAFLARLLAQMQTQYVMIHMPRFKFESGFNLNNTLAKMGMPDAFNWPNADFSGLNGVKGDLFLSGVFHKAWIEVTEEGTEADARTALQIGTMESHQPPPPPVFRADHPFVFLIRDIRSGSLLFVGRLADPRA
ncbi:MAG: serpin family protein [Verrucomicrobiota bacterium]|jgi:serpin B